MKTTYDDQEKDLFKPLIDNGLAPKNIVETLGNRYADQSYNNHNKFFNTIPPTAEELVQYNAKKEKHLNDHKEIMKNLAGKRDSVGLVEYIKNNPAPKIPSSIDRPLLSRALGRFTIDALSKINGPNNDPFYGVKLDPKLLVNKIPARGVFKSDTSGQEEMPSRGQGHVTVLNPNLLQQDILSTLVHEGNHALEHYTPYIQNTLQSFLTKKLNEEQKKIDSTKTSKDLNPQASLQKNYLSDLYKGVQNIINLPREFGLYKLDDHQNNEITQDTLQPKSMAALVHLFNEIPAFALETFMRKQHPWQINENINDDSRRLLRRIMKEQHQQYRNLGLVDTTVQDHSKADNVGYTYQKSPVKYYKIPEQFPHYKLLDDAFIEKIKALKKPRIQQPEISNSVNPINLQETTNLPSDVPNSITHNPNTSTLNYNTNHQKRVLDRSYSTNKRYKKTIPETPITKSTSKKPIDNFFTSEFQKFEKYLTNNPSILAKNQTPLINSHATGGSTLPSPPGKYAEGGYVSGSYDHDLNTNYREPLRLSEYLSDQTFDDQYNTGEYDDSYMSYGNAYDDDGQQSNFREGGVVDINNRDLPRLAELIEGYGRNGDTELAHINPIEAHILKSLGGSGTINPVTGLREYSFWKKPWKAIRSVIGGGAGALVGNMIAPGIGGIIGGALGQGAQHAARGKNVLQGALKGAGMGAALPSAASALGWGAGKIGATGIGSSLSNYGNTNAILPALGLGNSSFASNVASYSPYSVLAQGMGREGGQGLGVNSGDYAENYYDYMLDRQKKQDNMGFTDKLQDYLTEPKNLLTLGTTAAQYAGRQKPKSPEKIAEEERRYRNASRKMIAEIEADEALETARSDLKKKKKNKRLEEDINNMGRVNRRVVSPEEFARTGRWLEYTDDVGNPVRMKGGGLMHSPYAYLMEERYYPRSSDGYLDGDTGGQDDLIDARLSDGEYVLDASTVSDLGDGNNSAGARKLDNFRRNIREHKRGGKVTLPPRAKSLENYLRG